MATLDLRNTSRGHLTIDAVSDSTVYLDGSRIYRVQSVVASSTDVYINVIGESTDAAATTKANELVADNAAFWDYPVSGTDCLKLIASASTQMVNIFEDIRR